MGYSIYFIFKLRFEKLKMVYRGMYDGILNYRFKK